MKKRTLSNAVLLLVAASLAVFITLIPDKTERIDPERLSRESAHSVAHIRLELGSGGIIELNRNDDGWQLVDPLHIAANDFRIDTLLRVLSAPVHARIDAKPGELARFGLQSPRARLLLDGKEILFGDTEPIHGRRYLLFDGKVALVDDTYFSHLSSSAANYVDPVLLGDDPNLRSIAVPGMRVYAGDENWRLEPGNDSVSAESISRFADAWRKAQATAVRPYEQSLPWGGVIEVELADGRVRFDIARTEYEVILGRKDLGIQYHLTKGSGTRLLGIEAAESSKVSL